MLRKSFYLLAIAVLVVAASSSVSAWRITYLGNVEPDTPGSCGVSDGITFQWRFPDDPSSTTANRWLGGVVNDPDAIDGKAYRINDDSSTDWLYWRTNAEEIGTATGATIVARVKTTVGSDTNGAGNIGIQGSALTSYFHWGEADASYAHVVEPVRGNWANLGVPNDGEYHIIRLTAQGNTNFITTVPYDQDFDDAVTFPNGPLAGHGGWGGAAEAEVSINNGRVQVAGNGVETNAYLNVWADPDAEGKIHIQINAKLLTAGDCWCSYFRVYDRGGVNIANWQLHGYGDGSTVMGSIKGRLGGQATELANLQMDDDGSFCEMIIDVNANTCEYIVDGVSLRETWWDGSQHQFGNTWLPCGTAVAGNSLGRIEIARFPDGAPFYGPPRSEQFPVCAWDNVAIQGQAVATTGSRTMKLFVDENPNPVLVIPNASQGPEGPDCFLMGLIDPAAMDPLATPGAFIQDIYFDWIVGSADGAFAPGEEVGVLGHGLPIQNDLVTTIAGCKTAPLGSQVELPEAVISQTLMGNVNGNGGQVGLGICDQDRNIGIRVITTRETYTGAIHPITGYVAEDSGERVIVATDIPAEIGYLDDPLPPVAMNNAASAGGAFGFQSGAVKDATAASGLPAYTDSFTYANGALAGNGSWVGDADGVSIVNGELKISGGYHDATVTRNVGVSDCGTGKITVSIKVKLGSGIDNYWYLRMQNAAGVNLAQWMGCGNSVTGRSDTGATSVGTFTGGWQTLTVQIDPTADTAEYFLGATSLGVLSEADAGNALEKIVFFRYGRDNNSDAYVSLDDLTISPSPVMSQGLNNVGLYETIYGRVTWIEYDNVDTWNSYYYVDDGSGIKDGSGNVGVRCLPASFQLQLGAMPDYPDDFIAVTGVMGLTKVNGADARCMRTFWFTNPY